MAIVKRRIPWRVRRRIRLYSDGFLRWEVKFFRGVHKLRSLVDFPLRRPYIMRMRVDRRRLYEEAKDRRFTMAEYEREVIRYYFKMGWVKEVEHKVKGKVVKVKVPDVWKMFRYFYNQSVDLGDYIPPERPRAPRPHYTPEQKEKEMEKRRAAKILGATKSSGDVNDWIEQLQARLKVEADPQRIKQFRQQIKNLRRFV